MMFVKALVAAAALAASATAFATPVTVGGEAPDLQVVLDRVHSCYYQPGYTNPGYVAPDKATTVCKNSTAPNVNLNQAPESGQFQIEGSGGSIATMILEVAGNFNSNTFGVYDVSNKANFLQLFGGTDGSGKLVTLSADDTFMFSANGMDVQFGGATFGYYLGTANGPVFYSQAGLNGGADQMVAFRGDGDMVKLPKRNAGVFGSSSYILAWEDLPYGTSDKDFNDMVVYVESVTAVPEPGSLALLGLGLAGLAAAARRKQKQA